MSNLTQEQLQNLEGMERANVEARITLLRNVQQMLDGAVAQLNVYSQVMGSLRYVEENVHQMISECFTLRFCPVSFPAGPGFPGYPMPSNKDIPSTTASAASPAVRTSQGPDITRTTESRLSVASSNDPPISFTAESFSSSVAEQQMRDVEATANGTVNDSRGEDSPDTPSSELIRKRRLQRFNSQPVSSMQSSLTEKHGSSDKCEETMKDGKGDQ